MSAIPCPASAMPDGVSLPLTERNGMVGDRADAMLEVMDEGMHEAGHEGKYRRIEVITGRRQRRNWTDE